MNHARVLAALKGVKPAGGGHVALCPAHDDQRHSLSIGTGQDGRILLKCHARCPVENIVAALRLQMSDLMPADAKMNGHARLTIVRTYDYRDEQDRLVYQIVRLEPKDFRARRPNPRGGWTWRMTGVALIPYNLHRLVDNAGWTFVTEGEKDALSLACRGLPATTNPFGAGKWKDAYTTHLTRLGITRVVLLPDSDAAGQEHMAAVARSCAAAGMAVQIVTLPGLPPKGDVSDWLAQGHTPDDLLALANDAARWSPADSTSPSTTTTVAAAGRKAAIAGAREPVAADNRTIDEILIGCGLGSITKPVDMTALEHSLRALQQALDGTDAIRRATVREELARRLRTTGITSAKGLVDAALQVRASGQGGQAGPSDPTLADDEPWPDPVDGAALLLETTAVIRRYVVLSDSQADAMALWNAAAHAIEGVDRMPMLLISSPTPECGKSTAATVMSGVVPRPILVANLTPAVLFRLIDKYRPTLLADEVDSWLTDEKSELRGVFNAAHWRSGAVIPRCVGDDHDVKLFNVFGPKLMAMIGRPPATMLSRSITITLRRKRAGERVDAVREECLRADLGPLRQQWRRWATDHLDALRLHDPVMPAALPVNRASDNWRPLLSIADLAGGDWPARARAAALALSGVRVSEDEPDSVKLLADVQIVFRERGAPEYLSSEEIIATLKALPERSWADWNKGRGISPAQLANRLRDFGTGPVLRTRKTRLKEDRTKTAQRWHREDFTDAWSRYVTADPEHPEQSHEFGPEPGSSRPEQRSDVPGREMTVAPMNTGAVPDVLSPEPESGDPAADIASGWGDYPP